MNDPKNCPVNKGGRNLLEAHDPKFSAEDFFSHAAAWLVVSVLASLAVAAAFLQLVKHHSFALARATIGFQLAVPTLIALGLLLSGNLGQGLLASFFAGLSFFVFYIWRHEIGVSAKLLSVAGHGLADNVSLIGLTVLLSIAALVLAVPLLCGAALGLADGHVVPNPLRAGKDVCVDEYGVGVSCCVWEPRPLAAVYIAVCMLGAAWTMLTAGQVRAFVVSGTVAQWYFSPPGAPTVGAASRSLRHALTSSFGTNAFGGLILTLTNAVKQQKRVKVVFLYKYTWCSCPFLCEFTPSSHLLCCLFTCSADDQANGGGSLLGFLVSCLASIYEYLTKFATVMAAISGEGLLDAGRRVTDLLARNMLTAFATTIWFPQAMLSLASITLSALWGATVWASYKYLHGASGEMYPTSNAVVLGATVGVVTLFVLSYMAGVLLSVLDAVFVCFALDKDRHAVANAEMYEALLDVAEERGVLVQGPDGELGFGAAATQGPYAPPRVH